MHFESVFFGELDKTLPGREIVVDICHQPWGKGPLLILNEHGNLLGRYMTMRSRQHRLVDWFGTGEDLIFCGQTRALLDAQGNKRARFETPMPDGARGPDNEDNLRYMIHLADVTGNGRPDLVVNTVSIEYLTAPGAVIASVFAKLKPGGVLAVTFSNRFFPSKANWSLQKGRMTRQITTHANRISGP